VVPDLAGPPLGTMAAMHSPSDLARLFGGRLEGSGDPTRPVAGLCTDSREVVAGGGFVALRGETDDGHRFVGAATAAGAALAVVAEDFTAPPEGAPPLLLRVPDTAAGLRAACEHRLAELRCHVVGITGSVGKTTAKELCALVLEGRLRVAKTPGNLNTWTGIPLTVLSLREPVDVFVCEMAMSARGEIRDLATFTHPRTGVLLNVGLSHIELLGSQEAIAEAKAELLEALPADGMAVCNADDEQVRRVAPRSGAGTTLWFGLAAPDAQFRAVDVVAQGIDGTTFTLVGPDGVAPARLRVPGTHVVVDALAAAAVASAFGIGVAEVAERLAMFEAPPQRGRVQVGLRGARIYDDSYNSSPASLAAALDTLGATSAKRRVAVIGDMLELGSHTAMAHRQAGRHAARVATTLIAVGEQAFTTVSAALAAGMEPEEAFAAPSVDHAVELARERCDADTAVLVKASHGMALERVVEALLR
jgi:UDP-N-acetylmuramoyl-tripeptide--D-alanyl-D-alanine ligase